MAYERLADKKVVAQNLNSFVESSLILMRNQRVQKNAEREQRFLNAVLEDNLSLDDQLAYRRDQLSSVPKSDTDERERIRKEIASLKDVMEVQKFNDEYLAELMQFNSGTQSLDSTISWLEGRLTRTTDINIKNNIKEQLNQLKAQQYTTRKNVIERQTQYANEDKSESVLTDQIDRVSKERKQALLSGNDDFVSVLDLQLQSLKKTLSETRINKSITDMSVSTMTGQSALALLNEFNSRLESASADTPITIGGVRFESEQEFWSSKRTEYLNDRTVNGFFGRYTQELKDKIDYRQSRGVLKNNDMTDVNNWYEGLKDRPELVEYEDKIGQEQQKSLKYTADLKATETLNQFATDLDAVKAVNTLSYLQDNFGVNLTSSYQKVIQMASQEKEAQIQQILGTMGSIMSNNPGITQEDALKQAIASGAGVVFSPEELATKKASDVITEAGDKATQQQFSESGPGGITVPKSGTDTFQPGADFKEGGLYKTGDSSTVYKYEGGKLRPFEGAWNGDRFEQATGKTFSDVETVSSLSGASVGKGISTTEFKFNDQTAKVPATKPAPAADAPAQPQIIDYQIKSGDTISAIAARNKTTVQKIQELNKDTVKDVNKIYAGQTLKLPKL